MRSMLSSPEPPSEDPIEPETLSRTRRRQIVLAIALLVAVVTFLLTVLEAIYGGEGRPYRDLTGPPLVPESEIEVAVESEEPVGNVAVAPDGRIYFTLHPEGRPEGPVLLVQDGPAAEGHAPRPLVAPELQAELFETPLGIVVDRQDRLWTVDHGIHGLGRPRLLAFDLATLDVVFDRSLGPEIAPLGSFLQDLQIDPAGETAFLADASFFGKRPALVVIDLVDGRARRVLEGHPSVAAEPWLVRNPIREMRFLWGLVAFRVGVDGLALSRDGEWLAYGAMTHDTLYRIPVAALRDPGLGDVELAARIEAVGPKPLSDGLSTDLAGNVLVTDIEHGAVVRISSDGELETLVRTDRIRWADALSYGPDDWLFVADSAIPHLVLRSRAHVRENAPYRIVRFRPGVPGVPGQ